MENDIAVGCERIRGNLATKQAKSGAWNEMHDAIHFLEDQLTQWRRKKIEEAKVRHDEVQKLLDSGVRLSFDQDIMYRAKRRMLAGRYADSHGKPEADCFILESLIKFFEGTTEGNQLLLCTENLRDFGVQLDERRNALHPLMKEGLPPTDLFTDLKSLLNFLKDHEEVKEPAPEEVNKAIEREKSHEIEKEIETELAASAGFNLSDVIGKLAFQEAMLSGVMKKAWTIPDMSGIQKAMAASEALSKAWRSTDMSGIQKAIAASEALNTTWTIPDNSWIQKVMAASAAFTRRLGCPTRHRVNTRRRPAMQAEPPRAPSNVGPTFKGLKRCRWKALRRSDAVRRLGCPK